jgi:hypothetical protein
VGAGVTDAARMPDPPSADLVAIIAGLVGEGSA